jgi:alanine-synthesizing transaminase
VLSSLFLMFSDRTNWHLTPNRFTQVLDELRAKNAQILDLTISNPTHCGFQYEAGTILAAFQNSKALVYDPQPKGLLVAREEIARYYREDHRASIDTEALLLTTSTSEAYSFVFHLLCNPQDEILVPKPSYPLFEFLGGLADVSLVPYALEYSAGWRVDFDSLRSALTPRTRAILLVHPNNPTGSFVRAEEVQRFNSLCEERDIALIVDEVFLAYAFDALSPPSFVTNRHALTFTLSGLSKIAALPQMKFAWIAVSGPSSQMRAALDRLEVIADTYLSLSAPTQWAAPTLFAQRHSLRTQILQRIHKNRAQLQTLLAGRTDCGLLEAEGGWYGVLRVAAQRTDEDLTIELLRKHHVVVHPGHFYDFPGEGYLVISLITPVEDFRNGVEKLLAIV